MTATLALAGCAGNTPASSAGPAASWPAGHQLLTQAASRMHQERSLTFRYDSVKGSSEEKLDVAIDVSGNCTGTYDKDGAGFLLVREDGRVMIKPNDKYWVTVGGDTSGALRAALRGRWLAMTGQEKQYKPVSALCDTDSFLKVLENDSVDAVQGETVTIDGVRAVPVREKRAGTTTTAYVARDGAPRIIRMETAGSREKTTMSFGFDKKVTVEAPPRSDTVTVDELRGSVSGTDTTTGQAGKDEAGGVS
ncbi:hypothetical protein [Streptomyces bauhiniae]